jgi:hypothetical protein
VAELISEAKKKGPDPWQLEELSDDELKAELVKTEDFVVRMRNLWDRPVPLCWFFHQDLGLELIAARCAWESLMNKGSGHGIYNFLGHDLPTYVEPRCKVVGDNESQHRVPGSEAHRKVDTSGFGSIEAFLESQWFGWIWRGKSVQEQGLEADSE